MNTKSVKVGDIITVRMKVTIVGSGGYFFANPTARVDGNFPSCIDPADILSVEPPPLAVGDKVRKSFSDVAGEVRAIEDDHALIRWPGGDYGAYPLSGLTRVYDGGQS